MLPVKGKRLMNSALSVEVKRFSFFIFSPPFAVVYCGYILSKCLTDVKLNQTKCLISYTCTKKRYFICLICGDTMSFVQKIERLLEERNIQKKKMLEDLNLNINTFSVWRKRGTIPSAKVLQKIADYFGVPVSSLFDDSDTPATPAELQDLISRTRNLSAEEIKELDDYLNFIISKRK
nr:MAG TPA: Repressor protein CI [Caudoviricetes sp.]